jgi:hypothetical protein
MPAYKTKEAYADDFTPKDAVTPTQADVDEAKALILKSDKDMLERLDALGIGYRESNTDTMKRNHSHAHTLMHTCTHTHTHTQRLVFIATSQRQHIHTVRRPATATKSWLGQLLAKGVLLFCQLFAFLILILSYPFAGWRALSQTSLMTCKASWLPCPRS